MGRRKFLRTAFGGDCTEEALKDLKEGEEFRRLRGDVRTDISGRYGVSQSTVESGFPAATTCFLGG